MSSHSIVFIDSRVTDYETLIAGFSADTRWHVLVAQQDGVAQIERLLGGKSELDAIYIISHGAPGALYLGSTVLTSGNLPDYAQRLQSIGASLTATGDLLLYGCNVAQGTVGLRFINTLGQLTGADVTASDDISGIGGDWVLETASGPIAAIGLSSETYASALNASIVPDISLIAFTAATGADSAKPSLSFSVALSENFSQTMSLSLLYWAVNNEQTWISLSRTSSSEPFVSQVQLPEYAKSGTYEIRAISVRDNNGTQLSLSSGQLQTLGHEVSTTLINPNADEVEPALGSFSAGQPYWADDGSLHIDLSVTASDAGSGLKPSFVVELTSPTGVSLQQWANFNPAGNSVVDFILPRYAPTGSYVVNTVRLTDQAGNHSMSQPWLAQNQQVVQLINPEGDSVAPAVSTFTLSAVYDPQTNRPKIVIKGSALDELSGLSGAYVRFSSPEGLTLDASWMPITPLGKGQFAFEDYKALSTEFTPGIYKVQYLFVQDAAGNRTTLASELQNQGGLQDFVRVYFPVANEQTLVQASDEADFVFGTDLAAETLVGGGGNDYLYSGAGDDVIDAGAGDDEIVGGDGAGDDTYIGGDGIDTVRYTSALTGIIVNLEAGTASGNEIGTDTLTSIENVIGGQSDDLLTGSSVDNVIEGYTGNDTIDGGGGTDTARYSGNYVDYKVTQTDTGYTVVDKNTSDGDDGTDALSNIEILSFADQSIVTSTWIPQGNNSPTGSVTISGTATQGQTLTVTNTLADADGLGSISYQWQAAGLDIAGATGNSLTLTQAEVGQAITVVASYTDQQGTAESMTSSAITAVVNVDDAARATLSVIGMAAEGSALNASLSNIADIDGATSTTWQWQTSANGTSGWSNLLDATSASYAIAADQSQVGQYLRVLATTTDVLGGTTTFTGSASAQIANVNDTPVTSETSVSGSEDVPLTGTLSATDADDDSLTYTSVTPPAHGTVVLNPNGSYTYTPAANYSGTDSFTFKASDGTLDSNTATVSITVTPVNDTPVLANPLADRSVTLGSSLNFAFAGNTFTDVDSPSLTYTAKLANGAALPSWLSFNPTTRTFSGTPTAANLGTLTVQVTASDGALSVADTFDLVISERPNTSPTASNTSVSTKEDTPLTGTLPGATDAESDPVTYAKASDPAKGTVSVNPSGAFTYTPAANANGADSFTYTVTDDRGASSTYSVSLTITPVNDAPVITPLAPLVFVDTARSDVFVLEQAGQIQAQDIDSASLSYRISGGTNVGAYSTVQGTYGSLQVHTGTGAYTFFANNAAIQALKSNASETFTLTVSDGALTAEAPMTVQIRGANDAPVLIAPLSDQTAYDAAAWSLTLSGAQFSDADTGDVLTYTATLANGAALPTWLSFDPATRMFSGTPSAADVGSLSIRVSASDGSLSASDVFSLVVNEYFEPVVDDSSVATYARSANQYTIRFDPVSKDLLVTDTDPQQYEVRKFTNAKRIEFADLTLNLAVSDLADTIAEPALNRIAELYVAFFNRVPDGDGMEFWLGQYRQGKTINDIADAFYNAGVYFSDLTGYRADMSNDDFIHIVYRNVLGRPEGADQEGLAFWRAELDSGRSAKGTLVSSILDAAHGSTFSEPTNPYHWVQKLLDNKLEVAKQVSVDWGVNYNSSEDSIAKGQAIAASITPDDTSMAISLVGVVVADMV